MLEWTSMLTSGSKGRRQTYRTDKDKGGGHTCRVSNSIFAKKKLIIETLTTISWQLDLKGEESLA